MAELDKTYHPDEVEARHYKEWEDSGAFAAGGLAPGAFQGVFFENVVTEYTDALLAP